VTADSTGDHIFEVTADLVNISGFNVTGATGTYKAGIYLSSDADHCNISNNNASGNYRGIYLSSSSNNNTITNNTANSNDGNGIYLDSSSSNLIYNNYFNNTNNAYDNGRRRRRRRTNDTAGKITICDCSHHIRTNQTADH